MMTLLSWILHYWSILIWIGAVFAACVAVRLYFGQRFALPVAAVGAALIMFLIGRKTERDNNKKRVQDIHEKREKVYEEIDNRNTTDLDVIERLRRGDF